MSSIDEKPQVKTLAKDLLSSFYVFSIRLTVQYTKLPSGVTLRFFLTLLWLHEVVELSPVGSLCSAELILILAMALAGDHWRTVNYYVDYSLITTLPFATLVVN